MIVIFLFLFAFYSSLLKPTLTYSDELENAYDDCLKEFNIAVDEFDSSEMDLVCFNSCIAKKVGIIENGQINEKEFLKYFIDMSDDSDESYIDLDDGKEIIESCIKEIPYVEDDCELFNQVRNCILDEFL